MWAVVRLPGVWCLVFFLVILQHTKTIHSLYHADLFFLSDDKTTGSSFPSKAFTVKKAGCAFTHLTQRCFKTVLAFCGARARQQALRITSITRGNTEIEYSLGTDVLWHKFGWPLIWTPLLTTRLITVFKSNQMLNNFNLMLDQGKTKLFLSTTSLMSSPYVFFFRVSLYSLPLNGENSLL